MSGELEMIVWDVQHGNAIYMKTPNGMNFMFDIGTGSYSGGQEFSPLRYLKTRWGMDTLHYLVISHPHADHISDIKNMFELDLMAEVLLRPHVDESLIWNSNQEKFREIIDKYLELSRRYTKDVSEEKNPIIPKNNGGVRISHFIQHKKGVSNINNHSVVSIVEYNDEKIILPGDIESPGWEALMENNDFLEAIEGTTIFVASHHGRESGFYKEIFEYFTPDIVIVSDGRFSNTSVTDRYRRYSNGFNVKSRSNGNIKTRYVLTTRKDGVIYIRINEEGKHITIK